MCVHKIVDNGTLKVYYVACSKLTSPGTTR